ncbi:MAG: hypothetical protein GY774_04755 [Planctomycetes bacterium]|nr:hypothetical protein [Planctomycetota bacterium]
MSRERVYIAAPFFNEEQEAYVAKIENCLESYNVSFFSPRSEGVIANMKELSPADREVAIDNIFNCNIKGILECTHVLAVIDDWDIGTVFEIGYAYAHKKRIVSVTDNSYGLNIMIGKTVTFHASTPEDAVRCIIGLTFKGADGEIVT